MSSSNPRLLCRTGEFAGITCEVGPATSVGRGSSNDVVIPSPAVSTSHARIYQEDEDYFIEDLDSSNGTRVDGMEVRGRVRLQGLHVITLAEDIDLIFARTGSAGASSRPQSSTDAGQAAPAQPDAPRPDAPSQPPGAGTEVVDASEWGDLPDLQAPDEARTDEARADESKSDDAEPDAPRPQQPPGAGTEVIDASAWGALPDLEPDDAGQSTEESSDSEPADSDPEPEQDLEHGRTMMQEAVDPLPELDASEEEPKKPEPEQDLEHGRTMMQEAVDPLPELDASEEESEPAEEPEADLEQGRTVMDQEVQPLPDLDAPGGAAPVEKPEPEPEPEPVPLPEVAVAVPGRPLKTFALKQGENVLGRSEDCDITIVDPQNQISRKHAVLRVSAEGITLTDSGSANGTFVNGQQVETAELSAGNSFRLGPTIECTLLQS